MISKGFPEPRILIDNEIRTLEALKNHPFLGQWYNKLATDANTAFSRAQSMKDSFDFESSFKILVNGEPGMAYVGGKIGLNKKGENYELVTYYLAICKSEGDENKPLRKFHFDYVEPNFSYRQPHPVYHLQQPGELPPGLAAAGHNIEHLFPWLSEPRLPYRPMSLALLINLTFKEFPDEKSGKFIERGEWRSLIKENEKLILDPYYEQCYEFVNKRRKGVVKGVNRLLTNDFYYGN